MFCQQVSIIEEIKEIKKKIDSLGCIRVYKEIETLKAKFRFSNGKEIEEEILIYGMTDKKNKKVIINEKIRRYPEEILEGIGAHEKVHIAYNCFNDGILLLPLKIRGQNSMVVDTLAYLITENPFAMANKWTLAFAEEAVKEKEKKSLVDKLS